MKTCSSLQLTIASLLFAVVALAASAAEPVAPPEHTPSPAVAEEDDTVMFCCGCFVVSEDAGVGCKASETLAGHEPKTELKDICVDAPIVTDAFLKEVCASSSKDLLVYVDEATAAPAYVTGGSSAVPPAGAEAAANPVPAAHPRMEVVFVLDTTGSMGAMIESAKQKIWSIANQLKSAQPTPEIRFGLVAYRDRGDAYVTEVHDLGSDLDSTYTQLSQFVAGGGGDGPESVNEALADALHKIEWSTEAKVLQAIFLVGDMPPHTDYENDVQWADSCREAKARGILINTLQCGTAQETEKVWREIAALSGGAYTAMLQDGHAMAIETSADKEIVEHTRALNDTVIAYGDREEQARAARNAELVASMSAESVADRSAFLNKTETGAVMSGKGDLVAELIAGRTTLEKIDPKQLDSRLAAMPVAERNAEITRQVERRRELQAETQKLLEQREKEVAEQMKAAEGTDEVVVLSPFCVIQQQAEASGFQFAK